MLKNSMQYGHQENVDGNDILSSNGFNFNASFPQGCQQDSVPMTLKLLVTMLLRGADQDSADSQMTLKLLVTMLLRGADIMDQDSADSQACLSIAQTIVFNCKKNIKKSSSTVKSRHSVEYEPPLPLYIGLSVHTQTRSKKLIMELHALSATIGFCNLRTSWLLLFGEERRCVSCPGLFTIGALDNLDHTPQLPRYCY